jgi:hypothetical protein
MESGAEAQAGERSHYGGQVIRHPSSFIYTEIFSLHNIYCLMSFKVQMKPSRTKMPQRYAAKINKKQNNNGYGIKNSCLVAQPLRVTAGWPDK